MTTFILILFVCVFSIIIYVDNKEALHEAFKGKKSKSTENFETQAYQIYLDWCKEVEETPITFEMFVNLVNKEGSFDIFDLLSFHPKHYTAMSIAKKEEMRKEAERKKQDDAFFNSAAIGYFSGSTFKGTLFGGDLLGGMLGSHLSKKKKKKNN